MWKWSIVQILNWTQQFLLNVFWVSKMIWSTALPHTAVWRLADRLRVLRLAQTGRGQRGVQDHGQGVLCLGGRVQARREAFQPGQGLQVSRIDWHGSNILPLTLTIPRYVCRLSALITWTFNHQCTQAELKRFKLEGIVLAPKSGCFWVEK